MIQDQRRRLSGAAQIVAAGLGFGFLGVFGKLAFASGLTIGELLTVRFLTATVILGASLALFSPRRLRVTKQQLMTCALLGIMGYAVFSTLYFKSIEGVSVSLAALLLYTYPIMVALGAWLAFKERLKPIQWLALPATILGLVLLLYGETTARAPIYVIAGIGAALCYAIYILVSSRAQAAIDPLTSGLYVIGFAALGLLAFHRPDLTRVLTFSNQQILVIAGIAIISTIGPLVLFLGGLQKLGNTEASILSTVEPLTAAIAGQVFFSESMSGLQLAGGLLILSSLAAIVIAGRSSKV